MKYYLVIIMTLLGSKILSQDIYFTVSSGYGTFTMNKMKRFQQTLAKSPMSSIHPKVIVSFPPTLNWSATIGMQLNDQQRIGFDYSFQNTAGRNSLVDYSGAYNYDLLLQSHSLGLYYNQRISQERFGPVMQLQIGYCWNLLELKESLTLYEQQIIDASEHFASYSIFIEPLGGFYYYFNELISADILIGFNLTTQSPFLWTEDPTHHLKGRYGTKVEADWTGIRLIASIYFKLPKKKAKTQ
ncbi:MAG: hypothetical protein RBR87_00650 [Bacteroidales bacterium]|nr:hypothetical protein [Bacteroidales bacterium]